MRNIKQLMIHETTITAIINIVLGGGGNYISLGKNETIPLLGGSESLGFSILVFSILFPILGTMITTFGVRKKVSSGNIQPFTKNTLKFFPHNTVLAALLFTFISAVIFVPIAMSLTWLIFGESLPFLSGMAVLTLYMVILTVLLIPVVIYRAAHL